MFSDILLAVDFDRTLTAPDSTSPQRNLDAIRYFMDNGGAFTVNTGRSVPMTNWFRDQVSCNAPLLLYNGSAAWDASTGQWPQAYELTLDPEVFIPDIQNRFPEMTLEQQDLRIPRGKDSPRSRPPIWDSSGRHDGHRCPAAPESFPGTGSECPE